MDQNNWIIEVTGKEVGPINAVDDINTNLIKEQNNGTAITYQQIASEYLKN